MTIRPAPISRRRFLTTAAAATSALSLAAGVARPSLSRAADRPRLTHGLQSGDVSIDSGVVWARADRPARLAFDIATIQTAAAQVGLINIPMEGPNSLSIEQWNKFEQAYYRIASLMNRS